MKIKTLKTIVNFSVEKPYFLVANIHKYWIYVDKILPKTKLCNKIDEEDDIISNRFKEIVRYLEHYVKYHIIDNYLITEDAYILKLLYKGYIKTIYRLIFNYIKYDLWVIIRLSIILMPIIFFLLKTF